LQEKSPENEWWDEELEWMVGRRARMNGGMKSLHKPLNKGMQQEWNAFNKRGQQI
jgi:hypothetical protein